MDTVRYFLSQLGCRLETHFLTVMLPFFNPGSNGNITVARDMICFFLCVSIFCVTHHPRHHVKQILGSYKQTKLSHGQVWKKLYIKRLFQICNQPSMVPKELVNPYICIYIYIYICVCVCVWIDYTLRIIQNMLTMHWNWHKTKIPKLKRWQKEY